MERNLRVMSVGAKIKIILTYPSGGIILKMVKKMNLDMHLSKVKVH